MGTLRSAMSLKEAPAPHYLSKVGLKRTLTAPSQLLLGKCKSRHKPKISCPRGKRLNSPDRGSKNVMPNHTYSVKEEAPQKLPGSTLNPLGPCEERTRLECTSEPLCQSLKADRDLGRKDCKAEESPRLRGWRKFFCRMSLCPRLMRLKPALSNEDLNHGFTYYNQQTRDSLDNAVRPSIIYQVIEQEVTAAEVESRHCTKTERSFLKGILCLRKKKLFSSKPNFKGLEPNLVVQDDTSCPCLQLRKRLRPHMRSRAKKPSPFFQERIGGAQEYIHEETIVLSNRHVDEVAGGVCQSAPDSSSLPETLEVSVDVTPLMSECESRTCAPHDTPAERCGKPNSHAGQERAEYTLFREEEMSTAATNGTDKCEVTPDISICQKDEDEAEEEEENHAAVNVPENLVTCESSSVTSQVNQEDKAMVREWEGMMEEDGQAASNLNPTNDLNCVKNVFSSPPREVMDTVDELLSCPDVCHGQYRLDISQREEAELSDVGSQQHEIIDGKSPEVLLYQTACALVRAAMEAALSQLEAGRMAGYDGYDETGDY